MKNFRRSFQFLATASFLMLALPAAKEGCGPNVPIGSNDCGGPQGLTCQSGEYCRYENDTCGTNGELGACMPLVVGQCEDSGPAVCGCDGADYLNDCYADLAGVSIAHGGACGATIGECGGPQALTCQSGEYCRYDNDTCGANGELGVCAPLVVGQCEDTGPLVCGCDGADYLNDCYADLAGVSVAHVGECNPTTVECGGPQGITCSGNNVYCDFGGQSCGLNGEFGECVSIPTIQCEDVGPAVCGCDGFTYTNDCYAFAAGVSIAYSGACN